MKKIVLITYIFIIIITQTSQSTICNSINCPSPNGKCHQNKCTCNYGYQNFNLNQSNIKYCSYEQTNKYLPFILELLLPSIGHFYIGKIYLGILKLILLFTPIICMLIGYYLTQPNSENGLNNSGFHEREKPICELIILGIASFSLICFVIMEFSDFILFLIPYYYVGNGFPLIWYI